jgi:hypothetical protein
MQILIDIPEELYEEYKGRPPMLGDAGMDMIAQSIASGKPIPRGCDIQRIVPKRVDVQKWIYTECPNPNCNYELSKHHGDGYYSIEHEPNFCPNCGQALLWKSEG